MNYLSSTNLFRGIEFNDRDYAFDLLLLLKNLEQSYMEFMMDASNEYLYCKMKDSFTNIFELHRKLYEIISDRGFYKFEGISSSKLNDKFTEFSSEYRALSN